MSSSHHKPRSACGVNATSSPRRTAHDSGTLHAEVVPAPRALRTPLELRLRRALQRTLARPTPPPHFRSEVNP